MATQMTNQVQNQYPQSWQKSTNHCHAQWMITYKVIRRTKRQKIAFQFIPASKRVSRSARDNAWRNSRVFAYDKVIQCACYFSRFAVGGRRERAKGLLTMSIDQR
jgi:hypothetical protein